MQQCLAEISCRYLICSEDTLSSEAVSLILPGGNLDNIYRDRYLASYALFCFAAILLLQFELLSDDSVVEQ
jgi:hypothetical protein